MCIRDSPGDVLPTENSLCEEYGASRVTIRRSIKELIDEGVLERGHGKTARVVCESVPRSLNRLGGLKEQLSASGIKCSSFILDSEIVRAEGKVGEAMKLPPEESLYKIERLRYANGKPLCYQLLYLPVRLCPDLDVQKLVNTSLYEIIEKEYGLKILDAVQELSLIHIFPEHKKIFQQPLARTVISCPPLYKSGRKSYNNNK